MFKIQEIAQRWGNTQDVQDHAQLPTAQLTASMIQISDFSDCYVRIRIRVGQSTRPFLPLLSFLIKLTWLHDFHNNNGFSTSSPFNPALTVS